MKVIIGPSICGFSLNKSVVRELFNRHPELFDEPFSPEDFRLPGESDEKVEENYWGSVLHEDKLYFLKDSENAVRCNLWLIEQLETRGSAQVIGRFGDSLKVVQIPDDIEWYLYEYEDGSEAIHEKHGIWR